MLLQARPCSFLTAPGAHKRLGRAVLIVRSQADSGDAEARPGQGKAAPSLNSSRPSPPVNRLTGGVVVGGPRPSPGPGAAQQQSSPIDVVPVEGTGEDAWAGIAAVDSGSEEPSTSFGRAALLVGGDVAALVLFAAVGRLSHGNGLDAESLQTAVPFIAGWLLTAPFLGGFAPEATQQGPAAAALSAARCWAAAVPLGLLLRGVSRGAVPPTPFIIVTLVSTLVLLGGWRAALAQATRTDGQAPQSAAAQAAARKNNQGGPFEFMRLLVSLVRRW